MQLSDGAEAPVTAPALDHGSALQYFPAVDGLRGLLSLGVLVFHVNVSWLPSGPVLIDAFFVISGFLITLVLQKNVQRSQSLQLARFWKRRLMRLYPAMLVMVITYLIAAFFLMEDLKPILRDAAESLLYVSNFTKLYNYVYPTIFGHTWSLSVEEQFYVIWPLLFLASIKLRLYWKGMLVFLSLVMLAAIAWRLYLIDAGVPWSRLYYSLETRMDAFVIGGMTAFAWHGWVSGWAHRDWLHYVMCGCAFGFAAFLTIARPLEVDYFAWQQSAVLVLTAGTILLLSSPRMSWILRLLSARALVAIGVRSYGIYLWHWPLIWLLTVRMGISGALLLAIVLPSTIVAAALTYRYVEKPVLAARRAYLR